MPVGQVIGQRPGLVVAIASGLGVDVAVPDVGGFGFGGGGHPLGFPPVGASLPLALLPVPIDESIEPIPADLAKRCQLFPLIGSVPFREPPRPARLLERRTTWGPENAPAPTPVM